MKKDLIMSIVAVGLSCFSLGIAVSAAFADAEPEGPASLTLKPMFVLEVVEAQAEEVETEEESTVDQVSSQEEPEEVEAPVIEEAEPQEEFEDLGEFTLTAYCGCEKCCGQWASSGTVIGSGGVPLIQGIHCASPLKNGTTVMIEGYGIYEVQDSTADWIAEKYNGKIIDIYFENHDDALAFGKRTANVKKLY